MPRTSLFGSPVPVAANLSAVTRPPVVRTAHGGYADGMTDVVDSDELLRRIQRARAWAAQEERTWRARGEALERSDTGGPGAARDAEVHRVAYGVVLRVLDEILTPGRHSAQG